MNVPAAADKDFSKSQNHHGQEAPCSHLLAHMTCGASVTQPPPPMDASQDGEVNPKPVAQSTRQHISLQSNGTTGLPYNANELTGGALTTCSASVNTVNKATVLEPPEILPQSECTNMIAGITTIGKDRCLL
jgi:hypothetical protein